MQSKAAVWSGTVPRPTNWCWWLKSPVHTAAEHTICFSTIPLIRDTYFYFLCHFMGNQSTFCSRVTIFISFLLQFAVFEARQIQYLHFSPSFHQLYCKQKAKLCPSHHQISATAVFTSKNQWTRRAAISPSRCNLYALHLWLYDRHLQCCHRWQAQPEWVSSTRIFVTSSLFVDETPLHAWESSAFGFKGHSLLFSAELCKIIKNSEEIHHSENKCCVNKNIWHGSVALRMYTCLCKSDTVCVCALNFTAKTCVEQSLGFLRHVQFSPPHDKFLDFLTTHSWCIIGHGH